MSITNIIFTFMGATIASVVWALIYIILLADKGEKSMNEVFSISIVVGGSFGFIVGLIAGGLMWK